MKTTRSTRPPGHAVVRRSTMRSRRDRSNRSARSPRVAPGWTRRTPSARLTSLDPAKAAAIALVLRAANADPRLLDARGWNPLHAAAAAAGHAPLVRSLVRRDLVSLRSIGGETPVDTSIRYARDQAAEVLLQAGAVPTNAEEAWPPLHDAARTDSVERAASLIAAGERVWFGKTAREIAQERGSKNVEAFLSNVEAPAKRRSRPLEKEDDAVRRK
jgi:ankyrin repeat protein